MGEPAPGMDGKDGKSTVSHPDAGQRNGHHTMYIGDGQSGIWGHLHEEEITIDTTGGARMLRWQSQNTAARSAFAPTSGSSAALLTDAPGYANWNLRITQVMDRSDGAEEQATCFHGGRSSGYREGSELEPIADWFGRECSSARFVHRNADV